MKSPSDPNLRLWIGVAAALMILSPSVIMYIVHKNHEQALARHRELVDMIVLNESQSLDRFRKLEKRCDEIAGSISNFQKHTDSELATITDNGKRFEECQKNIDERLSKNESDHSDLRTKVAGIGNLQKAIDESKTDILETVSEMLTEVKRDDLVRYEKLRDKIAQLLNQK
jgi:hypothetical protein